MTSQYPRTNMPPPRPTAAQIAARPLNRAQSIALVKQVKGWTIGAAITGFAVFGGLAALHSYAPTANAAQNDDSGGFFNGGSFGTGNSAGQPVTNTRPS